MMLRRFYATKLLRRAGDCPNFLLLLFPASIGKHFEGYGALWQGSAVYFAVLIFFFGRLAPTFGKDIKK